ncbi:DNA-invertase hin [Thalassoglobus neptunius]|uniref:DNA-invertase hin n=1 Tax=Thalassoglobus neptunius TaxID=1938619 RepID=A0A5C5WP01_9PLAN|nr:recombinase family protein [Thalassoglobus neptunius]TWT51753.1 DNA-invertase hin [Thalassoglobus neptunius]
MERPALQRLIEEIDAGRVDCVIVYKVDRLSRSLLDFSRIMATFDERNVSFVSVTQQFNTTSSMGRLTLNILLSFAQFERELISERTRDKMGAARRRGKWCGGTPPYGYDVVDGKLIVNESEARRVREIFELYLDLKSVREVLKVIQQKAWKTKVWTTKSGKQRGGTAFTKNTLNYLLRNVTYIGQVSYENQIYSGEHRAIVDSQVFAETQKRLDRNRMFGDAKRSRSGALLSRLIRCQSCGCGMSHSQTRRGSRSYRYYVCLNAMQNGYQQCPSPTVSAPEIERFVVEQIREVGQDVQLRAGVIAEIDRQRETENHKATRERNRLEHELAELSRQLEQAALTQAAAQDLAELQTAIELRNQRLLHLADRTQSPAEIDVAEIDRLLNEFDELWEELSPAERQQLIHLLVEQVQYHGEAGEVSLVFSSTGAQLISEEEEA